jgi:hypothetical protein
MLEQLDTLEGKLAQLVERYAAMRDENARLRQELVAMENANKLLNERCAAAGSRLETLYNSLPD